ncbi:MAG: enterobactin transporter EntS, partial [Proteobacteria bacterium]|nr:enterobactin transporter EntS [Pseudomonadota bacterium]
RVNSLWNAQDVVGDSLGALGLGALARILIPSLAVCSLGMLVVIVGGVLGASFVALRQLAPVQKMAKQQVSSGSPASETA